MTDRSLVTILAAIGGVLVIVGGILGALLGFGPYGYGPRYGAVDILVLAILAVIFGLIILVVSGYTHVRSADPSVTGGFVLLILGIVTWVIGGLWLLVGLGSFLTILAGLILVVWILLGGRDARITGRT
ncbi:MAG: hypothetical protein WBF81_03160 [Thermoplasmata archaeon]